MTEFLKFKFERKVLIHKNSKIIKSFDYHSSTNNRISNRSSSRIAIENSQNGARELIPKPTLKEFFAIKSAEVPGNKKVRKKEKLQ